MTPSAEPARRYSCDADQPVRVGQVREEEALPQPRGDTPVGGVEQHRAHQLRCLLLTVSLVDSANSFTLLWSGRLVCLMHGFPRLGFLVIRRSV